MFKEWGLELPMNNGLSCYVSKALSTVVRSHCLGLGHHSQIKSSHSGIVLPFKSCLDDDSTRESSLLPRVRSQESLKSPVQDVQCKQQKPSQLGTNRLS
jgi:hypothetical protein